MASSQEAAPAPVHGLLRKWVNFGKLYRPRYFILRDGTLQYLKARPSRRCSAPCFGQRPRCALRQRAPAAATTHYAPGALAPPCCSGVAARAVRCVADAVPWKRPAAKPSLWCSADAPLRAPPQISGEQRGAVLLHELCREGDGRVLIGEATAALLEAGTRCVLRLARAAARTGGRWRLPRRAGAHGGRCGPRWARKSAAAARVAPLLAERSVAGERRLALRGVRGAAADARDTAQ
jgi:hypothetical protein